MPSDYRGTVIEPGADLRDFPFMPLDVRRLRDSELALTATDAGFRAAVLLWCCAWHQVPAGTLPDDDRQLSMMAGFGRSELEGWRAVREEALHGFGIHDGRLHHPVIAEKAIEAWRRKCEESERRERDKDRKADMRSRKSAGRATDVRRTSNGQGEDVRRKSALREGQGEEIERSPPPTPPATGGALVVADGESSLEHRIMAAFMEKSVDKGLTWPPSEREHVTRLVERARAEPDAEAWIKRFLETAWRLKQEGKGIWRDRPWMPRTFAGRKAITWVIEAMGESPNQATMEDLEWLRQLVKGK